MPTFTRHIGIDYSGAETPSASLKGLRVYLVEGEGPPTEVPPPPSRRKYWTRKGVAHWLVERLAEDAPTLVGIDHGFSFPLRYFEVHGLPPDWPAFLDDFQRHWPTDEDNTYVDFVRHGSVGNGAARMGNARWRRLTEERAGGAKSVFHFDVQGSVAKSTHSGIPWLRFIRQQLGARVHFWPFDGWDIPEGRSAVAEVYPALWSRDFAREGRNPDQHDAFSIAAWLSRADRDGSLAGFLTPSLTASERTVAAVEGWILGVRGEERRDHKPIRTYTASDVREIVELLRNDPEISAEKFSGMERLADIFTHFEGMTEADIEAESQDFFRSERLRQGMRDLKSGIEDAIPVIKDAAQSVTDWSKPHLSSLLESAGSIGRDPNWFVDAEETLGDVVSAILQANKSAGAKALDAIVAKGAGAGGVAGVLGLVSSLGTASTGTAIASLSGAAATTAKLYWIGTLVGGGVAAGGIVVAGAGIGMAWWAVRKWRGKVRSVESLTENERIILGAIERLLPALREESGRTRELSSEEVSALSDIWNDLTHEVKEYDRKNDLALKHKLRIMLTARWMAKLGRNIPDGRTS